MTDAPKRIATYLTAYKMLRSGDMETIHGLHTGTPHEARLTVADLEAIAAEVLRLRDEVAALRAKLGEGDT